MSNAGIKLNKATVTFTDGNTTEVTYTTITGRNNKLILKDSTGNNSFVVDLKSNVKSVTF